MPHTDPSPPPPSGGKTVTVTWHPDRVTGATARAAEVIAATDPDRPCTLSWTDLACLVDIARAFTAPAVDEPALNDGHALTLPDPDAQAVRAWVEFWSGHPDTLPQEERVLLQRLADVREARRIANVSSGAEEARRHA